MSISKAYQRASQSNANRQSISYNLKYGEIAKRDEQIIEKFLMQKNTPPWHRGLSLFQLRAAMSILNALRDDTEQRTTHRVRACIAEIGLDPLISGRQVKFLMRLSRGNDLAFLWFLMEVHYKTPGPAYDLNEQLIMSSISHLDTITTLRELDRILPPGHPPLAEIKRTERLKEQLRRQEAFKAKQRRRRLNQPKNVLPYFRSLERPRIYGKSLYITTPSFRVQFGSYENYKNPAHIVQNEANRWYAEYDLAPSKRIVKRILNEELENIFQDYSAATIKGETLKPMCEHHRDILALEESLKNKLRVIARDRCLKMLDMSTKKKEVLRKRIMDQLEQEIGKYVYKFHKIARKSHRHCRVKILANECTGYDLKLVDENDENSNSNELSDELCTPRRPSGLLEQRKSIDVNRDFQRESGGNIYMLAEKKKSCPKKEREPCRTGLCLDDRTDVTLSSSQSHTEDDLKDSPAGARVCITTEAPRICPPLSEHNYNYGHSESTTPTESQTYFEAPRNNNPYQFDYQKIFRFKSMVKRLSIRKAFVSALNKTEELDESSEEQQPTHNTQTEYVDRRPNMSEAITRCVRRIWKNKVANKNIELEQEQEAERKRSLPIEENKSPLDYEEKYYDPDDDDLMLKMLKDALEYMSKDPKFVLASMPESYKLPMLREWIGHRYGKVYSRLDRYKSLQKSIKIFRALDKLEVEVRTPNTKEIGTNLFMDYGCHDYLLKKAKRIQKAYYSRLNTVELDYTRIFWFAMQPYLCSGGPPRNTFFAYMPANNTNIKRFRIWKKDEFVNVKAQWEKRMAIKERAAALPK